jgi:hypothetical protein
MTTNTSGEPTPVRYRGWLGRDAYAHAQAVTPTKQSSRALPKLPLAGRPMPLPARTVTARPVVRHLIILACYLAAGIAVTWPRATYLTEGKLPATRDAGVYVWDFWWLAHQVEHLGNPWFTRAIAAPVGAQLGYHALMPLEGVVMLPVTLIFGPSASYNLLSILLPGLMCYAMYRAARLWLPSQTGAIAAGAFFGLSSDLTWHAWYQLNLAAGALFLPLVLEASVRLRRNPRPRQAVILGVVLGGSLLTDQQSAVLVAILAAVVLVPWLVWTRPPARADGGNGAAPVPARRTRAAAALLAVAVALVLASPQIAAMVVQSRSGGAAVPPQFVNKYYTTSSSYLPGLFSVSPRAVGLGLTALKPVSYAGPLGDGVPTFGLLLTVLGVIGLALSWRRRTARLLALLWLASAVLMLGSTLQIGTHTYVPAAEIWYGVRVSRIMPFTWFVRVPGLAGFREATRFVMLGLVPASLLAGATVNWLRYHVPLLIIPVVLLGILEAGWGGDAAVGTWADTPAPGVMRTALPALDGPIAADHSASIVVDVPFGLRGGVPLPGEGSPFDPEAQVLATADGHPRAVGYFSRLPAPTLAAIRRHAFYAGLLKAQNRNPGFSEPALLAAARLDARRIDIGWVIVWHQTTDIRNYLARTGFRFDYRADGAEVYRPMANTARR